MAKVVDGSLDRAQADGDGGRGQYRHGPQLVGLAVRPRPIGTSSGGWPGIPRLQLARSRRTGRR
ncbi:hypothetical protein ACRAWD_07135 [Caulobacter segnis]